MSTKRDGRGRRGRGARRGFSIESLERRALLAAASETFTGPNLAVLINQAEHGKNTMQAQVDVMLTALRSQMQSGPLADFEAGATGNVFVAEAQALEASFEQNVDVQLSPKFLATDQLLKLQGQFVVANIVAANQQESVGLITPAQQATQSQAAIASLTAGPILAFNTKPAAITSAAKTLSADLSELTADLGNSFLTLAQVDTTLDAEAEAFRSVVHAGIQRTQLAISGQADLLITGLESAANTIAQTNPSNPGAELSAVISSFDNATLGTKGLFAPHGALAKAKTPRISPNQTTGQAVSLIEGVSASAVSGQTSTITATLTEGDGSPMAGQGVAFTVDGSFAGVAVTNFLGVATLIGVPNADAVGTDALGVIASYLGGTNFLPAEAAGNLVVSQSPATIGNVSGTATFGGTATLTATLTSAVTSLGLPGQTVNFSVDGIPSGSAVTDDNGVATISGVAITDAGGTDTGGILASYAGSATQTTAAATGNLVVAQAGTSLAAVSGTAQSGGTATLQATLLSATTGRPISGQTLNFYLDNVAAGTAVTDGNGVATLSGVATTDAIGTDPGGIVVNFPGSTSYAAAANATGNLVVGLAGTNLINVSGTASFGAPATLTATLESAANAQPVVGSTVSFTLDGTAVGTAVTGSTGIATLSNVATSLGAGTDTNGVVATFAGDSGHTSTTTTGNLVVNQAGTSLSNVAGTSAFGGPATLTATLTSQVTDQPIAGQTVTFTLSNVAVGTAVTNASGVATLTGVTANDAVGTLTDAVVAQFAGTTNYVATGNITGNLVVSQAATTLSGVAGTATFGATATLTATLKSSATGLGIQGETVQFALGGTNVGTALTDANGLASLSAVPTTQDAGTYTGDVLASFGGDSNYVTAPNASGNLVIGLAPTNLTAVSGTAPPGGPATLMATLISTTTSLPIADQTVSFTLDGKVVGTMTTNGSGVATLTGVPTSDADGTHTGVVIANYAGDANHVASQAATGDLVVG
jgi:hypothetical protein